ncbi:hypothetical protein BB560_000761 [Smittium megazygosporum]|uniref:UDP-N-acetylglucosamine--dolichyl-phosphate N-acetylglucosaminephosphotransferase n=1 Tax=Smittium megazygosporum TaxID=133381 RepID=A0A2T9ZJK1_9FUNG|nr:hypothetical protein BB560_000761 [Smittium megazygosporum]
MPFLSKYNSDLRWYRPDLVYKTGSLPLVYVLWQIRFEPLLLCISLSILAGIATLVTIPGLSTRFKKVGLYGMDMNKRNRPVLAEGVGVIAATFYLIATICFIPFLFNKDPSQDGKQLYRFPFNKFGEYLSALLSLQSMVFLGFADDVLNLRWRFKLILPTVASIPVLMVYYVSFGQTHVVVPKPLHKLLGASFDMDAFYYIYMGSMAVFCTNSINILAGVNGVEVIQSIIIAVSILINNIIHICYARPETVYYHSLSLVLVLPFLCVSLALFKLNKYPAKVFVGDTYCYFAGMTFAVAGILGHFSKTLLLFFLPQIVNFLYSIPQLFRLVPCPRHRMPNFTLLQYKQPENKSSGYLSISSALSGSKLFASKVSTKTKSESPKKEKNSNGYESSPENQSEISSESGSDFFGIQKLGFEKVHDQQKQKQKGESKNQVQNLAASGLKPVVCKRGLLTASKVPLTECSKLGLKLINFLEFFGLVQVWRDKNGVMKEVNNFTMLNFLLIKFGPMPEYLLTRRIMYIQIVFSLFAFFIRFSMAPFFYDDIFK